MRRAVVFPAPFGPISPKVSPFLTLKLNPSTARISPKFLTTFTASTAKLNFSAPKAMQLLGL
jgi:hypothetical protein